MKKLLLVVAFLLITSFVFADVTAEAYRLKIPPLVIESKDKLVYAYQMQEKLRIEHNVMGEKYRNGEITHEEWREWLNDYYEPKSTAIVSIILEAREQIKKTNDYGIEVKDAFETISP